VRTYLTISALLRFSDEVCDACSAPDSTVSGIDCVCIDCNHRVWRRSRDAPTNCCELELLNAISGETLLRQKQ